MSAVRASAGPDFPTCNRKTPKQGMSILAGRCFLFFFVLLLPPADARGVLRTASTGDLELRARKLETLLVAPCCFTQTIDQHESEAARAMRAELRQWLAQGLSEDQILETYLQRYGPRILVLPPRQGFNRLLYWIPYVIALASLIAVCLLLWKWYRRGQAPETARGNHHSS
jgi:cytochrome c-type biogenesis protein CcmH/NrfF